MRYCEYDELLNRLIDNLRNEMDYYKSFCIYLVTMVSFKEFKDEEEVIELISSYFDDLITDSCIESEIVNNIAKCTKEKVTLMGDEFFEGTDEYELFVLMLKRINNSSKRRAMDAYPIICRFYNLVSYNVSIAKEYKTIIRKKYLSENEYKSYTEALKNKD